MKLRLDVRKLATSQLHTLKINILSTVHDLHTYTLLFQHHVLQELNSEELIQLFKCLMYVSVGEKYIFQNHYCMSGNTVCNVRAVG